MYYFSGHENKTLSFNWIFQHVSGLEQDSFYDFSYCDHMKSSKCFLCAGNSENPPNTSLANEIPTGSLLSRTFLTYVLFLNAFLKISDVTGLILEI